MKEQFVTYEIAKRLKHLGFDDNCFGYFTNNFINELKSSNQIYNHVFQSCKNSAFPNIYNHHIASPLWQQAEDWLRKLHNIHIEIYFNHSGCGFILTKTNGTTIYEITDDRFYEYEKIKEVSVLKAIQIIENRK